MLTVVLHKLLTHYHANKSLINLYLILPSCKRVIVSQLVPAYDRLTHATPWWQTDFFEPRLQVEDEAPVDHQHDDSGKKEQRTTV